MNTVRLARAFLVFLLTLVFSWVLPHYFWKAFDVSVRAPRVSYSPVENRFLLLRPESKSVRYVDLNGKEYTREEYERLLPLGNYRQLAASGQMPDSLRGVKLDLKVIAANNLFTRIMAADIGLPQIPLYPLFESQSGRVRVEMPTDFFRIRERMEFLDAETNTVQNEKSQMFTDTLLARGFVFPAKQIAGNPTTRKPFDEGYFVVDAKDAVYHIKMVRGKPYCVKTGIPAVPRILQMFIAETGLREFYGMLVAENNSVSLISYDNYRLIRLPLTKYDARTCALFFNGDLFFRTVTAQSDRWLETVVTDREYGVVDSYHEAWPTREETRAGAWAAGIFPFSFHLEDDDSAYVDFYGQRSGWIALWGLLASVVLLIVSLRLRRKAIRDNVFDLILVAVTGIFGFLAVHMIPPPEE
jgi:hypothetical protein